MNGSASASVADVAGGARGGEEAPSESAEEALFVRPETDGNAEDTYQHGQPVYFPEELVDNWVSFSCRGLYYCYNISLRGCFNTTAAPTNIILAVKCDMGPEFLLNSFSSGGVEVTIQYMRIIHLNQEQVIFVRRFQTTILSLLVGNELQVSCGGCLSTSAFNLWQN